MVTKLLLPVTKPFADKFKQWSLSRRPKGKDITLTQKQIFIFPTLAGWAYLLLSFVLLLIATNYQNNLISAVAYLLIALGVLSIHYTFFNLSGLRIKVVRSFHCAVGEMAEFQFQLSSHRKRNYDRISIEWRGELPTFTDVDQGEQSDIALYLKATRRGRLRPPSLKIETVYPFGFFRAWSWIDPDIDTLVYPKAQKGREQLAAHSEGDNTDHSALGSDGEDFSHLDEFNESMSTNRIAWKQFAQGRGLLAKQFESSHDRHVWLDWQAWPELNYEAALRVMCYWAQQYTHQDIAFGIKLPHQVISPSVGSLHLQTVMEGLATAPFSGSEISNGNTLEVEP